MKPWLINALIIFFTLFLVFFINPNITKPLLLIIFTVSAIWVYQDSKKLNIQKYKKTVLSPSTSPGGAAFIVWLIWIIAFPMYLSYRKKLLGGKIPLKEATITNS